MKRIAIIDRDKCKAPEKCDYLCQKNCPIEKNNIKLFKILEDNKPSIDESLCIGCSICEKKCPFNAIKIINLVKEPDQNPIYQYGLNTFRLYKLPIIKKNNIIGIIGRNGIGKSTAINILSGLYKPNFGDFNKKWNDDEIIKMFKGTELQSYFKDLYEKKIKVSYKIQNVYLFSKLYGELTVKELLSKVTNDIEGISNRFEIKNILDNKVKNLSGGELQKVVIIFTSLMNHNIYFVDEPTNYLDIYERLRIGEYLQELKENKDTIIIIDHDLLFIDSLADIIYILYGIKSAYGVFSNPIGVSEGINQYLEGYLKNDNVRIRDKPIKLYLKSFPDKKEGEVILYWENLNVNNGNFRLYAEKGEIRKNNIIGIIGRNGIGKSTFAKVLAGELKYEGTLNKNVKISYKPQYFDFSEYNIKVKEFLYQFDKEFTKKYNDYLHEMNISDILENDLSNLSGGEAQIVYTFGKLIEEADLYIIDEPFANLDIEQRLNLSKFIRDIVKSNEKTCIVIDHDITFLDYISDKMLLFLGEPGKNGNIYGPMENSKALNEFLKSVNITVRVDPKSKRKRINKIDSYLDRLQKAKGMYYMEE